MSKSTWLSSDTRWQCEAVQSHPVETEHLQQGRLMSCGCLSAAEGAANSAPHSAMWVELSMQYVSLDKVQITLCGPRKI